MIEIMTILGFIGAICVLLAFWLLTHKVVSSHSKAYMGLNLIGGSLLAIETYTHQSYSAFAVNAVWVVIAIYGLSQQEKSNRR